MQHQRGHVDEKQDIHIALKYLSLECLLLVGEQKKTAVMRWRSQETLTW